MECSICLEECENYIKLNCNHIYHYECISKWIKSSTTCPLCRKFMGYFSIDSVDESIFPKFIDLYPIIKNK